MSANKTADSTPECLRAEQAGRGKMADKDCRGRLVSSTVCYVTFNCMLYEQYKEAGDRDQEEYYWRSCLKALAGCGKTTFRPQYSVVIA